MKEIDRLEMAMCAHWWVPPALKVVDRPELCYIRSESLCSSNAVMRFHPAPGQSRDLLAELDEVFKNLKCKFSFYPHRHGADIEDGLRQIGFAPKNNHEGRIITVDEYTCADNPEIRVEMVENFDQLKNKFQVAAEAFGDSLEYSDEDLADQLRKCTPPEERCRHFLAFDGRSGKPIGSAGIGLYVSAGIGTLFAGGVIESHRNRGVYKALLKARIDHAKRLGIDRVGLFARVETSAPIVARNGFRKCGEMLYWKRGFD